jgi:hypothetical protein
MEVSRLLGAYNWNDAIKAARDYRGGGMNDWYLPSIGELKLIYENLQKAGVINLGTSITSLYKQWIKAVKFYPRVFGGKPPVDFVCGFIS